MSGFAIVLLVLGAIAVFVIVVYNSLISTRNRTKEAWSDIDVQLKRRYDLIPNLIETVKGYAKHEKEVLESVTQARAQAINAGNVKEQAQAENMLTGALKSLFAVSENYPDLKANQNFLELQRELRDTEDKIMAARRFYNTMTQTFNTKTEVFPNNMIIGFFGDKFKSFDLFEIQEEKQRENVEVKF